MGQYEDAISNIREHNTGDIEQVLEAMAHGIASALGGHNPTIVDKSAAQCAYVALTAAGFRVVKL